MNLTLGSIISKFVSSILQPFLVLVIAWAVISFLMSLFKYLQGDAAKKEESLKQIGWGILVLFVMVTLWGLVAILSNTFSNWGGDSSQIDIPYFQSSGGSSSNSGSFETSD